MTQYLLEQHLKTRIRRAGYHVCKFNDNYTFVLVTQIQGGGYGIMNLTKAGAILSVDIYVEPVLALNEFLKRTQP